MRAQVFGLALLLGSSSVASAADIAVTSTADTLTAGDGACTLREAISNADSDSDTTAGDCAAGSGTDLISLPPGRYTRTAGLDEFATHSSLTLRGADAESTIIDAEVDGSPLGDAFGLVVGGGIGESIVSVERVTITGAGITGIHIAWNARLTLSDALITQNGGCLGSWGCFGQGIRDESAGGTRLIRTAVTNNVGTAVISAGFSMRMRIESSTISGNSSKSRFYCAPPGYSPQCWCQTAPPGIDGSPIVSDSTIADNTVDSSDCIDHAAGAVTAGGTFTATVISNPGISNCAAPSTSLGHNLDSDGTCGLTEPTDLSGVDPMLGPLQANGGPTPTHALLPGSPAIDAIPPADCTWDHDGDPGTPDVPLTEDQRGEPRPTFAGCDIGAYEATSFCGDGIKERLELCDDGDQDSGDGCDRNCTVTACGNGIVTLGEECDDGNTTNTDRCTNECRLIPEAAQVLLVLTGGLVLAAARRRRQPRR